MSGKNKKKFEVCQNCSYRFAGVDNYCPNCGQENHDLNMPFGHVVLEVLEGTFHFDTKVFRTLKLLLFKPGRLTGAFIENKRAPFVPPIRLYVFISFIFFLVLAADVLHKGEQANAGDTQKSEIEVAKGVKITTQKGPIVFNTGSLSSEEIKTLATVPNDSLDKMLRQADLEPTPFKRAALRKASKFLSSDIDTQTHKLFKMLSVLMFILMPMLALIMKSAYLRRKIHYIQFLIVSLHYHCFVFILLTIAFLLEAWLGWNGFIGIALIICFIYLILELRYLFKQGYLKTFFKSVYITGFYALNLALFMMLALILSIALT